MYCIVCVKPSIYSGMYTCIYACNKTQCNQNFEPPKTFDAANFMYSLFHAYAHVHLHVLIKLIA